MSQRRDAGMYKRGRVWWHRFTDAAGKQRNRSLQTTNLKEATEGPRSSTTSAGRRWVSNPRTGTRERSR